ncbi:hypothetical protein K437DRAFT_42943 [Tilletiaria anomala UBC 951]|uniref:Uncharacterized protein n=1 Tax=Tilletiaria anomala (strain ATCC 24038 / CBS 436.72 / UBC 951) TaxID=1037660 RepID=A0A066VF38_TILAU|nr:uncharacterized protein K437DRAFT_42943 [Tilletiaria anomala UBC 951]KDN37215.1 hypothetical protein K437DRAFT_42943 [Tilletiaria anomala UBC 951]
MPLKEHGTLKFKSLQRTPNPEEDVLKTASKCFMGYVEHTCGLNSQSRVQSHRTYCEEADAESGADGGDDIVDTAAAQPTMARMLTGHHSNRRCSPFMNQKDLVCLRASSTLPASPGFALVVLCDQRFGVSTCVRCRSQ